MQPALRQVLPRPCSRCPAARFWFRSLALQVFNKVAREFSAVTTAPSLHRKVSWRVLPRVWLKAGVLASSGPRDHVLGLSPTSWGALGESWGPLTPGSPFCKMEVRSPALRTSRDNASFLGAHSVSGVRHVLQQREKGRQGRTGAFSKPEISYLKDIFLLFQVMVLKNRARESVCARACMHTCTFGSK